MLQWPQCPILMDEKNYGLIITHTEVQILLN